MILVDGYNLLFRCIRAGSKSLREQREELIEVIDGWASSTSLDIRMIFDGRSDFKDLSHSTFQAITVIYSIDGQTADEYILHEVEASPQPQQIVVVSSDKRLVKSAREHGAKSESVEKFFDYLRQRVEKARRQSSTGPDLAKDIPHFDYYLTTFEERARQQEEPNCSTENNTDSDIS